MRVIFYNTEEAFGLPEGEIFQKDLAVIPRLHEQIAFDGQSDKVAIVQNVSWVFNEQWSSLYCTVYLTFLKRSHKTEV